MASELRLVEAIRETLGAELARDDDAVLFGEDVGRTGGVFRATDGLVDEYPDRVVDSPLGESGIVGLGVGLAAAGMTPIAEIQFQSFLYQGFAQLQQHVGRIRSRSRGTVTCPMTIRTPYGGGIHALEHHSESFEAGFAHVPGLKVVIPASPAEGKGLLTAAVRDPDPVVFMEPTRLYRATRESVPEDEYTVPLGEARTVTEGDDVTVVAWGSMLQQTLAAATRIDADVEVIDPRTIYPLDTETITESVRRTGRCVVVHEAPKTAGFAAEVVSRLTETAFYHLEAPPERVTGYDVPFPFFAREDDYLPDAARIAAGIERAVDG